MVISIGSAAIDRASYKVGGTTYLNPGDIIGWYANTGDPGYPPQVESTSSLVGEAGIRYLAGDNINVVNKNFNSSFDGATMSLSGSGITTEPTISSVAPPSGKQGAK